MLVKRGKDQGGSKYRLPTLPCCTDGQKFIGRETELTEIGKWMAGVDGADSKRVLVVSGPPGDGKFSSVTVAAVKACQEGLFKGGVFHIEWPSNLNSSQINGT